MARPNLGRGRLSRLGLHLGGRQQPLHVCGQTPRRPGVGLLCQIRDQRAKAGIYLEGSTPSRGARTEGSTTGSMSQHITDSGSKGFMRYGPPNRITGRFLHWTRILRVTRARWEADELAAGLPAGPFFGERERVGVRIDVDLECACSTASPTADQDRSKRWLLTCCLIVL